MAGSVTFTSYRARVQKDLSVAIARAMNKSAISARAVGARLMSQDLGLKVGVLREQIKIDRATPQILETTLKIRGERIPLIEFGARGPEPSRGRGKGVSYRLGGQRRRIPTAFIATVRGRTGVQVGGGHRGVFRRIGGARTSPGGWSKNLPIIELFGPSVTKSFSQKRIVDAMIARFKEQATKNLKHEVEFEVRRQ